ncbi:MAG: FAD-binding oxidoreductase [Leptospiraceae bacterium]|nr:FAD-binding oxidoreductase [Leptospiraceae bacterium]MDW8307639.1 FAD-binding oxidoreductase [Leptospiraceae bacterium]
MEGVVLPEVEVNTYRKANPLLARVILNKPLVKKEDTEVCHIVLDADAMNYREGQSVGVIPPGVNEKGNPHAVRLYSIASLGSRTPGAEKLSLTVKRVVYQNDKGEVVRGVCSNYLCDLKEGDVVSLTGPAGRKFLLPVDEDIHRPYVFMATGTGIAPFRAFLQRLFRVVKDFREPVFLFMGVRYEDELLYDSEFRSYQKENFHYYTALSRQQKNPDGSRKYIHHVMAEKADELFPLLQNPRTLFYMCGLKGMESGFDYAIKAIAAQKGVDGEELLKSCQSRLESETY